MPLPLEQTRTVRPTNKVEEGKNCYIVNCGDITPTKQQMGEEEDHGAFAHNVGGGTGQVGRVPGVQDAPKLQLGVNRQTHTIF